MAGVFMVKNNSSKNNYILSFISFLNKLKVKVMDFRNYMLPDGSHVGSRIWQFLWSIELRYNIKFLVIFSILNLIVI